MWGHVTSFPYLNSMEIAHIVILLLDILIISYTHVTTEQHVKNHTDIQSLKVSEDFAHQIIHTLNIVLDIVFRP
jgi:hypothetical protein